MIRSLKFAVIVTLAVALLAAAPFPAAAQSAPFPPMSGDPGAVFYELTESMKLMLPLVRFEVWFHAMAFEDVLVPDVDD